MDAMFSIDERLNQDGIFLKDLDLSTVILKKDPENPWILLVPRRIGLTEIFQMTSPDQKMLIQEINWVSKAMDRIYCPHKINVGSLGNIVPQLHIHIIGRYKSDRAWPQALWGTSSSLSWEDSLVKTKLSLLKDSL